MIHFDGANVSECRKYDSFTFCEIIFGGPTGGPTGGLRSQVLGLRYQVSGIRSRVSGLRSQVRSLNSPRPVNKWGLRVEIRPPRSARVGHLLVSGLRTQDSGLRSPVSGLRSQV